MTHRYSLSIPLLDNAGYRLDVVVDANNSRDALQQVALFRIPGVNPNTVHLTAVISETSHDYISTTGHQFTKDSNARK